MAYRAAPVDLRAMAEEAGARVPGRVDFAAAVAYAREHNPDLRRLAALARAAREDVPPAHLEAMANLNREHVEGGADPLALAGLGVRGAAEDASLARHLEAEATLREREREIAAGIAEAMLVLRALDEHGVPAVDVDPAPFLAAGLASDVDAARIEAARSMEAAERRATEAERATALARLRELLGAGAEAPLDVSPDGIPGAPEPSRENLLARPDLFVALAGYRVADAEFHRAVWEQYPSLFAGAEIELSMSGAGPLFGLRLPVGGAGPARAARDRREAARHALEAALLAAQREAAARTAALGAAEADAEAAAAEALAAAAMHRAALARLEIEPDAFAHVAASAAMAVREAGRARRAAVEEARARVAVAEAYGWPLPEDAR